MALSFARWSLVRLRDRSKVICFGVATWVLAGCGGTQTAPNDSRDSVASATGASEARRTLAPQRIQLGLQDARSEIRGCFAEPTRPERVSLTWRMNETGVVTDAEVRDADAADGVSECVVDALKSVRFSTGGERAEASWTFVAGVGAQPANLGGPRARARRKRRHDEGAVVEKGSPGRLPTAVIESRTMGAFPIFSHCLREAVEREPTLSGSLRMRFVVEADGRVSSVEDAESEVEDARLLDCLAEGYFSLTFPSPQGGPAHLRHTLLLNVD